MTTTKKITTCSAEETMALGRQLASQLSGRAIVFLEGGLGMGKTHFVKGIAQGLGVKKIVKSPTFTYVWHYPLSAGRTLYHYDFYRAGSLEDIINIGFFDELETGKGIYVIEWPELLKSQVQPTISIKITGEEEARQIEITGT